MPSFEMSVSDDKQLGDFWRLFVVIQVNGHVELVEPPNLAPRAAEQLADSFDVPSMGFSCL